MKIIQEIKKEHDEVRDLILEIENKDEKKEKIFEEFVVTIIAHHEAEEHIVFEQLPDKDEAQELKRELIAEHDCLLRQMQVVLDTQDEEEWDARFKVCKELFNHHIEEEENELFGILRDEFSEKQLTALYSKFEKEEEKCKKSAQERVQQGMILYPKHFLPSQKMEQTKQPAKKTPSKSAKK